MLPIYESTRCTGDLSALPNQVLCGLLTVAETRGSSNGRKVALPVVIVRGIGQRRPLDPVIVLHGGPGGGQIAGLAAWLAQDPQLVAGGRDWIFFDQRGTGLSVPSLDCGVVGLSDAGITDDFAVDEARACGLRLTAAGVDLSQYNTAAIVADIADLRSALQIGDYNLLGTSYGTRVAMGVMQRDSRNLRAVVLDSLWPPEASWTGPLPTLVSRETRRVLAMCAADPRCAARHPQLERRFDVLLAGWIKKPHVDKEHSYTADEVAAFLLDELYDDQGARQLPSTLERLLADDYSRLADFLQEQSGYDEGQFLATLCKEEFPFESPSRIEGRDGGDPIAAATARAATRYFAACQDFAVGKPDPIDNEPVESQIPTLILAAGIDAGCPVELAQAAVQRLASGQLIVFPNTTHGVRSQSKCAQNLVRRFLDDPGAPLDASCVAAEHGRFEFSPAD